MAFALNTCFDDVCAWNENAGTESLVTVFAATNEPWAIDSGFLRPGRLERSIFVGPLDHSGRKEYFHSWFHSKLMEYDVSILTQDDTTILTDLLADLTKHFTGADCALLVRKACLICYVECTSSYKGRVGENAGNSIKREGTILLPHLCHFQEALAKMEHSVSKSDIQMYLEWSKKSLK